MEGVFMSNNSTQLIGDIHIAEEAGPEVTRVLEICADVKDGKFEMAALEKGLPLPYAKPITTCPKYAGANLTNWDTNNMDCVSKFDTPTQPASLLILEKNHCDVALKCTSSQNLDALKEAKRLSLSDFARVMEEGSTNLDVLHSLQPNTMPIQAFNAGVPLLFVKPFVEVNQVNAFKILKDIMSVTDASTSALLFKTSESVSALELTKDPSLAKDINDPIQLKALKSLHKHGQNHKAVTQITSDDQLLALDSGAELNLAVLGKSVITSMDSNSPVDKSSPFANVTRGQYAAMQKCPSLFIEEASALNPWSLQIMVSRNCNHSLASLFQDPIRQAYLSVGGTIDSGIEVTSWSSVQAFAHLYNVTSPIVSSEDILPKYKYTFEVWRTLRNFTSPEEATLSRSKMKAVADYVNYHVIEKPFGYNNALQVWGKGPSYGVDHFWQKGWGYIKEDALYSLQACKESEVCWPTFWFIAGSVVFSGLYVLKVGLTSLVTVVACKGASVVRRLSGPLTPLTAMEADSPVKPAFSS